MRKELTQFKKGGELYWFLGIILISIGVSVCKKADLGVSMIAAPAFIIYDAIAELVPFFTVGVVEYIVQAFFAILLCAVVGKVKLSYLITIVVGVIYGYVLDLWLFLFGTDPFEQIWLRYVMLIVGDVITATGVACFFRTYIPVQSYDIFVKEVSLRYKLGINKVKLVYDVSLLLIAVVLALTLFDDVKTFNWSEIYKTSFHSLGLGTLITTIINSPIIAFVGKLLDKLLGSEPLLPKLQAFFEKY
ncbi:MAG: hypothetical protein J6V69_01690 [Clostridia bacterium]|nr:hypothetical protein [Clostridia bacterium]